MNYYFISGTSSGIGHALVQELLKDELNVVIGMGRHCNINHPNYKHIFIDLSQINGLDDIAFDSYGIRETDLVVLINNSARIQPVKYMGNADSSDIIQSLHLNLVAPIVLMNNFIKVFKDINCKMVILNVSSGAAINPIDGWAVYCSSKAGINMVSEVSQLESRLQNINLKVFAIAPGVVDTKMQDTIRNADYEEFSRLNEFKDLKKDSILQDPVKVAKAYIKIIRQHEQYESCTFRL